jgi:hypothetical protein
VLFLLSSCYTRLFWCCSCYHLVTLGYFCVVLVIMLLHWVILVLFLLSCCYTGLFWCCSCYHLVTLGYFGVVLVIILLHSVILVLFLLSSCYTRLFWCCSCYHLVSSQCCVFVCLSCFVCLRSPSCVQCSLCPLWILHSLLSLRFLGRLLFTSEAFTFFFVCILRLQNSHRLHRK